ncbi:hypothetical protein P9112_007252 [Eukaryota sp. TZLM1-RC]
MTQALPTLHDVVSFHKNNSFVIPTGWTSLDDFIGGGVFAGELTEFFGPSGSHKTLLAMQTSLHAAVSGKSVLVIDVLHSWSPHQISLILTSLFPSITLNSPRFKEVLACISLRRPTTAELEDFGTIYRWLHYVLFKLTTSPPESHPKVVIIDSISGALLPCVTSGSPSVLFEMTCIISLLKGIADSGKVVLAINSAVSNNSGLVPSLGNLWSPPLRVRVRVSEGRVIGSVHQAQPFRCRLDVDFE